jgi:hypothetical protein
MLTENLETCPFCRNSHFLNFLLDLKSNIFEDFIFSWISKFLNEDQIINPIFYYCAYSGKIDFCEFLFKNFNVDFNYKNKYGYVPIHAIIMSRILTETKKMQLLNYLLPLCFEQFSYTNPIGETALTMSVFLNYPKITTHFLTKFQFSMSYKQSLSELALTDSDHFENEKEQIAMLKILNPSENLGKLIRLALENGYLEVCSTLAGWWEIPTKYTFIFAFIRNNSGEELQTKALEMLRLQPGFELHAQNKLPYFFHFTIKSGELKFIKFLSEFFDSSFYHNFTPLFTILGSFEKATEEERLKCLKFFIEEKNVDFNFIDSYQSNTKNLLLLSIEFKDTKIVSYLLQHPKTNVNVFDTFQENVLSYLFTYIKNENDLFSLIQIYIQNTNGVLIHKGKTILQICVQHGFVYISKFLMEKSEIPQTDSDGNNILRDIIFSINLNFQEKCLLLKYCHEKNFNFYHKNNYGNTIFDLCGLHHEQQIEISKFLDELLLDKSETKTKSEMEIFYNNCKIC